MSFLQRTSHWPSPSRSPGMSCTALTTRCKMYSLLTVYLLLPSLDTKLQEGLVAHLCTLCIVLGTWQTLHIHLLNEWMIPSNRYLMSPMPGCVCTLASGVYLSIVLMALCTAHPHLFPHSPCTDKSQDSLALFSPLLFVLCCLRAIFL